MCQYLKINPGVSVFKLTINHYSAPAMAFGTPTSQEKAVKVKVMNLVRTAVHDIVPSEHPKGRFMYWDQKDPESITDMLWKRHAVDLAEEVRWVGSKDKLLHMFRLKIRETANNERSIQNIQMRKLYLPKFNREWALCLRTIPGEEGGEKEPPIIPAALLESLAGDTGEDQDPIQTLRSVIFLTKCT